MKTHRADSFPFLIIGIGLGLLAGMLWAPRPGKETRDDLRRGAGEGLDFLNEEAEKVRAGAGHWLSKMQDYFAGDRESHRSDDAFGHKTGQE